MIKRAAPQKGIFYHIIWFCFIQCPYFTDEESDSVMASDLVKVTQIVSDKLWFELGWISKPCATIFGNNIFF